MTRTFRMTRRGALLGGAALTGALAAPALLKAQGRIAWDRPIIAALNGREGDPTDLSIRRIPQILAEQYDIDISIEIHPASQLSADIGPLDGVQNGRWDIASNPAPAFSALTDAFQFMDLPFLYASWDEALAGIRSGLMQERLARAEAQTKLKFLPIVGAGGFRLLSQDHGIVRTPADLLGLRMRAAFDESTIVLNTLSAWGGVPTPLDWSDCYPAAQQGAIDGLFVQPVWTFTAGFHEVLAHATRVPSNWVGQLQVMNAATWADMPDTIKGPFMQAAQIAADEANALDREREEGYLAQLNPSGMAVYTPTGDELQAWREPALASWANSGLDADLLGRLRS